MERNLDDQQEIFSPLKGKLVELCNVKDKLFATKILGDGVAIIPSEGYVYAPFDGIIENISNEKHALALKSDNGLELLIHIGIDTVELEGKYFKSFIKIGDYVNKGSKLIEFDILKIKEKNYEIITPIIINDSKRYNIEFIKKNNVDQNDVILIAKSKL